MERLKGDGRVLHLVRPGSRPPDLVPPPPGHTVVEFPDEAAPPAEWDHVLDLVFAHDVVVTW